MKEIITMKINKDTHDRLKAYCKKKKLSIHEISSAIIDHFLDNNWDLEKNVSYKIHRSVFI